jgi:hypothetical protein
MAVFLASKFLKKTQHEEDDTYKNSTTAKKRSNRQTKTNYGLKTMNNQMALKKDLRTPLKTVKKISFDNKLLKVNSKSSKLSIVSHLKWAMSLRYKIIRQTIRT